MPIATQRGRPQKWTHEEYFRLWAYVDFYCHSLERPLSVRQAIRYIAQRQPWSATKLSAETLRRRYGEARKLHDAKIIGVHLPLNPTLEDWSSVDMSFVLGREDRRMMMGPCRYRRAEEEYARMCAELMDKYGDQL